MDAKLLEKRFQEIGARLRILLEEQGTQTGGAVREPGLPSRSRLRVDIRQDRRGEYFEIRGGAALGVEVLDARPAERHLLLLARTREGKDKFLCGHDERHWFVAAVPGPWVSCVSDAMEALKPSTVRAAQQQARLKRRLRHKRRNPAFIRQGEWFFVPAPEIGPLIPQAAVFRAEPLSRGRGKPHLCEFLYRRGGRQVYVCSRYPSGLDEPEYRRLLATKPEAQAWNWRPMRRDPQAYACGWVRHPDHATIVLSGWHRVLPNTENQAPGREQVVFLD